MSTSLQCMIAVVLYFAAIIALSFYRARAATLSDYFIGSKSSTWWLITLSMISDSVSGITFISVPGMVGLEGYSYLQVALGYFIGYQVIIHVLFPLYYRLNLISIYSYLGIRFGMESQKTASFLFIASRLFGSAARLYLAVGVLHQFFFQDTFSPLYSFFGALVLIVLYTYKGGIKSLVWTEAFQSLFLVFGIGMIFWFVAGMVNTPREALLKPQIFFWDPHSPHFFLKQIMGGMFITISMNGLDQNIMQMNLSCKSVADAQKNLRVFSWIALFVNALFLGLGALVVRYYEEHKLPWVSADQLLPNLVFGHLGSFPIICFVLGLTAATFSSASTVLPAIASAVEIDLMPERFKNKIHIRALHVFVAVILWMVIYALYLNQTQSLITVVLKYAGYTYGPILGLFTVGILTDLQIRQKMVAWTAFTSISLTAILDYYSETLFSGYRFGVELLGLNALIFIVLLNLAAKRLNERRNA